MQSAADDRQLLQSYAREQSSAAFAEIVERHSRWVFAAAYRQLHDRQLAEDAAQTVFILLARRSHSMPADRKLSGWLFNTLQFTVKNIQRARRRAQRLETRLAGELRESSDPAASDELALRLDAAVARLPAAERSAVLLRFYQDHSYEQMAQALAITEPTARKRISRATDLLRKRLGTGATTAAIGAAAVVGAQHASAALVATISTTTSAATAGTALPTALAATVKGTVALMTLTKIQIIAGLAILALAIIVPVGIVATRSPERPPAPVQIVIAGPASEPADYLAEYTLQPDEVVRFVNASPAHCAAMYAAAS